MTTDPTSREDDCTCAEIAAVAGNHLDDDQIKALCDLSAARVAAARAEALREAAAEIDRRCLHLAKSTPLGGVMAIVRDALRAVVSREPGEGDTTLHDLDDVAAELGVDLTDDGEPE